ncbi:MAG: ATP-binding cassette domain-containing protein [Lachnospiraceae bacterium]|nr:ATP-binding cassette domain-containing protein [Lachnospiraceae bacterium]
MKHKMRKQIRKAVIILFWLIVWQIAAVWTNNHILLVGPVQVLRTFVQNMMQPDFFKTVFCSFARIGLGFFLALCIGLLLGAVSYRFSVAQELLEPVMVTLKSIPVASFVVLLLIWFGSSKLSFLISFLIVFPNVYVNTIAGLKSADVKLLEMAKVFGMGRLNRFFYIYRPALMPYLSSCLKISLGMSWKSGVAAEVIGLPDFSLGERLYMSKIYLDTAGLFSWTLVIVLISYLFEKAVLLLIKIFGEWKPYPIAGVRSAHKEDLRGTDDAEEDKTVGRAIQISHIDKSFGELSVLRDYSLTMEKGQRYLMMSPSGTGKTTFLRILTGLDNGYEGTITGMPAHTGMVFQEDRLCEEYDAVCNIMLGMGKGKDKSWHKENSECGMNRARTVEYIRREAVKILPEDCLTKPVKELSGGMRRRVALIRAVMSVSELLILDEPFAGLDEENRLRSAEFLMEHLRGRTLLVTTHREDDVKLLRGVKVTLVF